MLHPVAGEDFPTAAVEANRDADDEGALRKAEPLGDRVPHRGVRECLLELRDRLVEERRFPLQVTRIVRNVLHFGHRTESRGGQDALRRTVFGRRPKVPNETLTRRTSMLAVAAALAAAAAGPPSASAHARLVSTTPDDRAVLASPPTQVTIRFDDAVRALGGTTVVANEDKRPVTAGEARARGRVITIPLRKLRDGDYTVRWRVLSDDGHTIEGVFAFAVGAGRAPPGTALTTGGTNLTRQVISRWLFFAGLLIAVGVALFLPLAWSPALRAAGAAGDEGALWPLAFGGFFLAFLGASSLIPHHGAGTTRFGLA